MTLVELLAMLAFMVWACVHTNGRIHWWADEREAAAFVAELCGELAFPADVVEVAMLDGPLPERWPGFRDAYLARRRPA